MSEPPENSPELVLAQLESLPTLPAVTLKVLQVTSRDDSGAADVIRLVRNDQSLTARILAVANSAPAGLRTPASTLDRAVPLIGFSGLRSVVLAVGVFECFGRRTRDGQNGGFDRVEFWKHSLAVACAAEHLAELHGAGGVAPEDAFVAGLLHDLGKVALDALFPKAYDRIASQADATRGDVADCERALLGADHTVVGRRLAERWRLPRDLQETIWLHHIAADTLPASVSSPRLIGLVQLADTLAREQRIGYSGNHVFFEMSPRLAERLGIAPEQLDQVAEQLARRVAEKSTLLGLDGTTPERVYVQAITRANAELGRLNAELLASNRRLAVGARYFEATARFERQLTDWSDPAAVLAAMTDAAQTALQRPRAAAFGLRYDGRVLDLCWIGASPGERGQRTQSLSADLRRWIDAARAQLDATVLAAPEPVVTLFAGAFTAGEEETPWVLPIVQGDRVAGGIIYFSSCDERERLREELGELRSFVSSLGLALGRANAQAAAQRLSEDLALTNRRLQHMQVELLRSRTLSMIAEMAAGAGHELNGPLTVISGRAQMLAATLRDPEAIRALQTIADKAHECSGIVTELMDFARPRSPSTEPLNVADLLRQVRDEWLASRGMVATRLRLELAPETLALRASLDRGQIVQALRELLSNAADAVAANQGTITIRLRTAVQPAGCEILVEDTGCGMSPAVLERAFDPFYSHRAAGRGRGLGLARAYRIIEAHGGRIWLESRPDEGTIAHVLLPCGG